MAATEVITDWKIAPTPVHRGEIRGPGSWKRPDFPIESRWRRLRPDTIEELDRAIEGVRRAGKQLDTVTAQDFPLPSVAADAANLRRELRAGSGFVIVKGLPIDRYTPEEASIIYWGIGAQLGTTLPQNVKGERLYSVRDEGYSIEKQWGTVGVRFSKTTEGLHFHTDSAPALMGNTPDVVALFALEVAKRGGESALVSAQTVHNILLRERPDYLERLYRPYHHDRRAELRPGEAPTLLAPVFTWDGELSVRYFRFYIPKGHEVAGEPLAPEDVAPLDYMESVMNREELQVHFSMERGDMQFVNNAFILHSRTAFEDHPEPERRRHLMRLWLRLQ